jgi:hypothetical protein
MYVVTLREVFVFKIHRWPGENSQNLAQKFDLILRQILSDSRI